MSKVTIWAGLKRLGLSDKAAAVVMGHAQAESGNETNRLQGDFTAGRATSIYYTAQVDNGSITRTEFIRNGPNGGGYGWLQWTFYSRKEGLYDTAKKLGVSIGSEEAALAWFWAELHQAEYVDVLAALTGNGTIREMSDVFMRRFEKPADQSDRACAYRASLCESIFREFSNTPVPPSEDPDDQIDTDPNWPPRTIDCNCSGWPEVYLAQAALRCHGVDIPINGAFDETTIAEVRAFQEKNRSSSDGVIGPNTWKALLAL